MGYNCPNLAAPARQVVTADDTVNSSIPLPLDVLTDLLDGPADLTFALANCFLVLTRRLIYLAFLPQWLVVAQVADRLLHRPLELMGLPLDLNMRAPSRRLRARLAARRAAAEFVPSVRRGAIIRAIRTRGLRGDARGEAT